MFHRFFFTVDHSRSSLKFRMPGVTRGRSEIGGGGGSGVSLLAGPCGGGCGPCAAGPGSVRGARGAHGTLGSPRRGLGRSPRAVWNPEGRLSVEAPGRALGIQPADPGPAAWRAGSCAGAFSRRFGGVCAFWGGRGPVSAHAALEAGSVGPHTPGGSLPTPDRPVWGAAHTSGARRGSGGAWGRGNGTRAREAAQGQLPPRPRRCRSSEASGRLPSLFAGTRRRRRGCELARLRRTALGPGDRTAGWAGTR